MTDRKAVIKNADMSEDMQQDAVDCATQAIEKYNIEKNPNVFDKASQYFEESLENSLKMGKPMPGKYWIEIRYVKKWLSCLQSLEFEVETLINKQKVVIAVVESITVDMVLKLKSLIELKLDDPSVEQISLFFQFLADSGHLNALPLKNAAESMEDVEEMLDIEEIVYDAKDEMEDAEERMQVTEKTPIQIEKSIIRIPNMELELDFKQKCYNETIFKEKYNLEYDNITTYLKALKQVATRGDMSAFSALKVATAKLFAPPATLPGNEDEMHSILFTLAYVKKNLIARSQVHVMKSKRRKGRPKRLDILIIQKNTALITELKVNCSASEALGQIFKCGYDKIPEQRGYMVSKKLFIGLHMDDEGNVTVCYSDKKPTKMNPAVTV